MNDPDNDHPDILTDLDPADERAETRPVTYATRQNYELDEIERLTAERAALKLEANAAFTEALLSLAEYAPSGGFVAPSNVRRILVRLAKRLEVKVEDTPMNTSAVEAAYPAIKIAQYIEKKSNELQSP